jgi:non-specific serine/threonine protein kinase
MASYDADTHWALGPSRVLSGRYEIGEEIGRGGMGIVFRAWDRALSEDVAIKVLHPLLDLAPGGLERLKREARIAHRLSHPNIVQLRNFEEDGPVRFLIMELVDGPSLEQLLKERGRLPVNEVLKLAAGMCAALDYAHSRHVLHCDIKPGNFLRTSDGTVKIADFGVARVARDILGHVTQHGVAGTPAFMSPEQSSGGKIDARSDIYGLAATLYGLLSGAPPVPGGDVRQRLVGVTVAPIADVPDHINRVLQKALSQDPADRWQTAAEFGQALAGQLREVLPSQLPSPLTSFFGREEELARLQKLFMAENRRLVTLTGPGGSGKTRLAVEAAARLSEPLAGAVWFVPLQDVSDPRLIADAVLEALALTRAPQLKPLKQVVAALERRPSLLVLDNFEHLVAEGAPFVRTLLTSVPTLKCLVTSRGRLKLAGEREVAVAPLPTPKGEETARELMELASVQLFADRAQALRPDFEVTDANAGTVAQLCRHLEGIPLALELAAARAQVMTPAEMLEGLARRFDLLVTGKSDVEYRHRTLRAAMDWSYQLLPEGLRRLFASLSVFRDGWTAKAAETVCEEPSALEGLGQLLGWSLILAEETRDGTQTMRFRMLDTLRDYARERLGPQDWDALRRRHAEYYLELAERVRREGPPAQSKWVGQFDTEQENLRAAMEWFGSAEESAEPGLRLAAALGGYWQTKGHWYEGREALASALARPGAQARTSVRAHALSDAAGLASSQGDYEDARRLFEEALAIYRERGDLREVAATLGYLAGVHWRRGDCALARQLNQEALELCRGLGDQDGVARTQHSLALIAVSEGRYAEAQDLLSQSLKVRTSQGDRRAVAELVGDLGIIAMEEGRYEAARPLLEQSLTMRRELGDRDLIAIALHNLGALANAGGDHERAAALIAESMAISGELGHKALITESLAAMAEVWRSRGNLRAAAALSGAYAALREATGYTPSSRGEPEHEKRKAAALRGGLGDAAFSIAWQRGHSMSLEDAVRYALKPDDA